MFSSESSSQVPSLLDVAISTDSKKKNCEIETLLPVLARLISPNGNIWNSMRCSFEVTKHRAIDSARH